MTTSTKLTQTPPVSDKDGKKIDSEIAAYKAVDGYNISNDERAMRLQMKYSQQ